MDGNSAVPVVELVQALAQQQAAFQAQLHEEMAANAARIEAITAKPPAARKALPATYNGTLLEDLELWFFAIEQYYADYYPLMEEDSPAFVTMISCHLGPSPMNWYRQFTLDGQRHGTSRSWATFKMGMRKRFLPPDHEFTLRERLFKLKQKNTVFEYVSEFQDILIQCQEPIHAPDLRFYFQSGLKPETAARLREHAAVDFHECIDLALRFDPSATDPTWWVKTATCHRCKKVGHIAPNCPGQ